MALMGGVNERIKTVLMGGGYTLQRVAERLSAESFVITSRDSRRCAAWCARGWNACEVAIDNQGSLDRLFSSYPHIETVIDSVPPLHGDGDPVRGVRNVVASLRNTKLNRLVYLSTTGVFGRRDGAIVDEDTPPAPWNTQGEARWLAEQMYRDGGCNVTALRLPAIYGPDRGMLFSLRNGTYRLVGNGEIWTNRIHVEDLATAIVLILGAKIVPEVLCIADDRPAQAREIVEYVCGREGLPWPASTTEDEVLRMRAYTMLSNQRVCNKKMKAALGISLRYPSYREGFYPDCSRKPDSRTE